jgi:hypothetical protein
MPKASKKPVPKAKKAVKKKAAPPKAKPKKVSTPKKAPSKASSKAQKKEEAEEAILTLQSPLGESGRVLSLSFLRDGDEFCVRLEMATGQITEFKNRSPDQLLTMVAGELEDLLS